MFISFQDRLKKKIDEIYFKIKDEKNLRKLFPEEKMLKNFIVLKLSQNNLLLFTMLNHGRYNVTWAHEVLCKKLERVEKGELKRLIVIAPPRFGKSHISSISFPIYFLSKNPHHKVMAVSYNSKLVSDFGRKARNICTSSIYQNIWSINESKFLPFLSKDSKAVNKFSLQNESEYIGRGLRGGIAGIGGHVIICDDWIRDYKDLNPKKFDDDIGFYNSTLYNRQESSKEKGNAAIIIVQTHWHKKDLIGQVENNDDNWEVFKISAYAEKDEYINTEDLYYYP